MATKNSFSIGEALSAGWKLTKKNFKFLFLLLLITLAVNTIPSMGTSFFEEDAPFIAFIFSLTGWVLQMVVSLGTILIALKLIDKKKAKLSEVFRPVNLLIPYFFGSLVYGLIIIGGLILLVIPGIVWGIKFRYLPYFMVDKNMGPIDALKASAKITKGTKWNLLFFSIVLGVINILGAILLLVGLFVTIPMTMLAEAYVYRKLTSK